MQIKTLAIVALAAGAQAQSLNLPIISPLVDDLLNSLGDVGNAVKTATGLTTGSGNNPLGLSPNLFVCGLYSPMTLVHIISYKPRPWTNKIGLSSH